MGGEIGISFDTWLVDRGIASAAETGVYGPGGQCGNTCGSFVSRQILSEEGEVAKARFLTRPRHVFVPPNLLVAFHFTLLCALRVFVDETELLDIEHEVGKIDRLGQIRITAGESFHQI